MKVKYQGNYTSITDPNVCPHCHVTIKPHQKWHTITKDSDDTPAIITSWQCSNDSCQKIFIALYKSYKRTQGRTIFSFERFLNGVSKGPDWPKPITELKDGKTIDDEKLEQSKFIKTYFTEYRRRKAWTR